MYYISCLLPPTHKCHSFSNKLCEIYNKNNSQITLRTTQTLATVRHHIIISHKVLHKHHQNTDNCGNSNLKVFASAISFFNNNCNDDSGIRMLYAIIGKCKMRLQI